MSDLRIAYFSGKIRDFLDPKALQDLQQKIRNGVMPEIDDKELFHRNTGQAITVSVACYYARFYKFNRYTGKPVLRARSDESFKKPLQVSKKRAIPTSDNNLTKRQKNRESLQITLPNGTEKEFLIYNVLGDGNCAFYAVGQERSDLEDLSIEMLSNVESNCFSYFKDAVFDEFLSYMQVIILGENGEDNDFTDGEDFVDAMTTPSKYKTDQKCQDIIKTTYEHLESYLEGEAEKEPLVYLNSFFKYTQERQTRIKDLKSFLAYFVQEFIIPVEEYWLKISKDMITLLDLLACHNQKNLFVYMKETKEGKSEIVLQNPLAVEKLHNEKFENIYIIYNGRDHFLKLVEASDEDSKNKAEKQEELFFLQAQERFLENEF